MQEMGGGKNILPSTFMTAPATINQIPAAKRHAEVQTHEKSFLKHDVCLAAHYSLVTRKQNDCDKPIVAMQRLARSGKVGSPAIAP